MRHRLGPIVSVLAASCGLLAASLTGRLAAVGAAVAESSAPAPAALPAGPTAIVAMGDSYLSGESAGSYEAGTDQPGNFCHRSALSTVRVTTVAGVDRAVNLACSGATTDNVRSGGTARFGEIAQTDALAQIARDNRVVAVVVSIGGNDVGFGEIIQDCLVAYLPFVPSCRELLEPQLPSRLAAVVPKVDRVLADIRQTMSTAGYADSDYTLVLQSYPSPVTENVRAWWRRLSSGCPFEFTDLLFSRTVLTPAISAAWRPVAQRHGTAFLDLSHAFDGHEVCARGITQQQEWATGITVDLAQIRNGVGANIVAESLHPNAAGHAQIARCLSALLAAPLPAAACRPGPAGNDELSALPALAPSSP